MKKQYQTPSVELVRFQYRDHVVAASGTASCIKVWVNTGGEWCEGGNSFQEWRDNQA